MTSNEAVAENALLEAFESEMAVVIQRCVRLRAWRKRAALRARQQLPGAV
jgi:hypothetical protein